MVHHHNHLHSPLSTTNSYSNYKTTTTTILRIIINTSRIDRQDKAITIYGIRLHTIHSCTSTPTSPASSTRPRNRPTIWSWDATCPNGSKSIAPLIDQVSLIILVICNCSICLFQKPKRVQNYIYMTEFILKYIFIFFFISIFDRTPCISYGDFSVVNTCITVLS